MPLFVSLSIAAGVLVFLAASASGALAGWYRGLGAPEGSASTILSSWGASRWRAARVRAVSALGGVAFALAYFGYWVQQAVWDMVERSSHIDENKISVGVRLGWRYFVYDRDFLGAYHTSVSLSTACLGAVLTLASWRLLFRGLKAASTGRRTLPLVATELAGWAGLFALQVPAQALPIAWVEGESPLVSILALQETWREQPLLALGVLGVSSFGALSARLGLCFLLLCHVVWRSWGAVSVRSARWIGVGAGVVLGALVCGGLILYKTRT